ncbi:MAG: hypothetical protein D6767_06400, partial [Candidatus Hydrogenedentota bacterium]
FVIKVYNSTDTDVSSEFNISALTETAGTWSFSLQAKQNSSVGSNYYVTIDYPVLGTNALTTYSTKGANEFSVTDATLSIVYRSMSSNEFEKVDGVGTDIFYNIYYDDGTEVTDTTSGNTGYNLRVRDSGAVDQSANFTITSPTYGADASCAPATNCWKVNVQANVTASAAAGYYFTVEKTATGNNDTLAEFATNNVNTPDANGNIGLDDPATTTTNEGEFKVNNATLYIVYQSISANTQERGDTTGINYTFNTYYKTGAEMTSDATEFVVKVYDSTNTDKTAQFSIGTPSYSGGVWTVNVKATNNAPVGTGYYITIAKNPGSLGALIAPEKASNMSTTPDPAGNKGLGSPGGEFDVTGAQLHIAYQSRVNASVQRLENDATKMTVFRWKVFYRDNSEETNDTGYSVTIYDNGGTDVTSKFDFYNWTTCSFDTTGFNETNHLKYTNDTCPGAYGSSVWKLGLRPKKDATIATGYYIVVSKAAGGEGDLLDPNYTPLTQKPFASKSTTETVTNGTWTGLGTTNGVFEVTGANLTVKFVADSITSTPNEFERADGIGITYSFTLHYPNGDPVLDTDSPDNFVVQVLDGSNNDVSTDFTIGSVTWDNTNSRWDVNVIALPSAANLSGPNYYRLQIYKNAGTDGNFILLANAKKSSDPTGTATDGGLGTGLDDADNFTGEFNVTVGTMSITYTSRTNPVVEQADDISPTYNFKVYFDDGITEETSTSGFVLRVYDSSNTVVDTFNLSSSAQTGTNFGVSALTYSSGYSVSVTPLKNSPVATGYYISIEKQAGTNGNTLAEYKSNASTTPDSNGNVGLGTTNGVFEVTEATLHIVYAQPSSHVQVEREAAIGNGVTFQWKTYYDNGTDEDTSDSDAYIVKVYDSTDTLVETFDFSGSSGWTFPYTGSNGKFKVSSDLAYTSGYWTVELLPTVNQSPATNFYITVEKAAGITNDTLAAYSSKASTTPDSEGNTGLGTTNGTFDVIAGQLHIVYGSPTTHIAVQRGDVVGNGVTFSWNVYYDNGTLEESSDADAYIVKVYDKTNTLVETFDFSGSSGWTFPYTGANGKFKVSSDLAYTSGKWQIELLPTTAQAVDTDFYITVEKVAGSVPDVLAAYQSKASTTPDPNGNQGLGTINGGFDVIAAQLHIVYSAPASHVQVQRADKAGDGVTFSWNVYYPNNVEESTDADSYIIKVYDSASTLVETFDFSGSSGWTFPYTGSNGKFRVSADLAYTSGKWQLEVIPTDAQAVGTNFYITVEKAAGTVPDTLAAYQSQASTTADANGNQGLGTTNGTFDVIAATLHIVYQAPTSHPTVNRGATAGNGITFAWNVYYGDSTTEETTDADAYIVKVYDKSDSLVETFDFSGSAGWTFPYTGSNGKFKVSADLAYNSGNSRWELELLAATGQTEDTDFYITVEKTVGSKPDTLAAYQSKASTTADAEGNKGLDDPATTSTVEGAFDVAGQIMHILYSAPTGFNLTRASSAFTLPFVVEYPDATKYDNGNDGANAGNPDYPSSYELEGFVVRVYRDLGTIGDPNDGSDVCVDQFEFGASKINSFPALANGSGCANQEFQVTGFSYNTSSNQWELQIKALKNANASSGNNSYYVSVEKTQTGSSQTDPNYQPDQLPEYKTAESTTPDAQGNKGLDAGGDEGNFTVSFATLTITHVSRTNSIIAHGDKASYTTYSMEIKYPDGTLFTASDAGTSDNSGQTNTVQVSILDASGNDVFADALTNNDFEINSDGSGNWQTNYNQAYYDSASQKWLYTIRAPLATVAAQGFYIQAQVTATGSDDTATAVDSKTQLGSDGVFDVGKATFQAQFVSIDKKIIQPDETTTVRFRIMFSETQSTQQSEADLSNLSLTKITIHKAEDGTEHTSDFQIQSATFEGDGVWAFVIKPTGSNFSKVGEYVQISGQTVQGDLIATANSKDLAAQKGNVDDGIFVVASEIVLYQNFPNPFNPTKEKTTIRMNLIKDAANADLTLKIFTVSGRLVRTFTRADVINNQKVYWDGKNDQGETVASGIYYCILEVAGYRKMIKIAVVK